MFDLCVTRAHVRVVTRDRVVKARDLKKTQVDAPKIPFLTKM